MSEKSAGKAKLTESKAADEQGEALVNAKVKVIAKALVAEGERSVAIDQAQGSIVNTGEIQGDVNIINVSLSQSSQESTLTASDIGSAVNLVKLNQSLSTELSKRIAAEVETARELFREGNTQKGFEHVQAIIT